jgi:hypothetical protein
MKLAEAQNNTLLIGLHTIKTAQRPKAKQHGKDDNKTGAAACTWQETPEALLCLANDFFNIGLIARTLARAATAITAARAAIRAATASPRVLIIAGIIVPRHCLSSVK